MKSCGAASVIGAAVLLAIAAIGACRETTPPGPIPPLTVATPSTPSADPSPARAAAPLDAGPSVAAPKLAPSESPVKAAFVDLPTKLEPSSCTRVLVAVVKGKATVAKETLGAGDVLVLAHAPEMEIAGSGLAVVARRAITPCVVKTALATEKTVVRASGAPDLSWAGGAMHAHLDVGAKASPEIYMGRLEGTSPVAEHTHPGTWEILAAVEAAGAFTLDGIEQRLGARQIVIVPPDTKHAWKPDSGSKLVAIQMYDPPGPEQRFVALAAAAKDAGK